MIIAAILLTVLGEWLRQFGDLRMILYSLLIIVLMILRPQGLFTWSAATEQGLIMAGGIAGIVRAAHCALAAWPGVCGDLSATRGQKRSADGD